MFKSSRILIIFLIFAFSYFFFAHLHEASASDFSDDYLQFSVEGGKIYFFQPHTGRVFVYQTTTSRFSHMLTLQKLGEDMKRSRSISVIEEETEQEY